MIMQKTLPISARRQGRHAVPAGQRGATLIVALTVVMVVGVLAASVSHDFLTLSRRVENQLQARQVEAYLVASESVARQALLQDLRASADVDYSLDLWAQTMEVELPIGILRGCLQDLQGRINLNGLATSAEEGYSSDQRRFIRLLQALEMDNPPGQTEAVMLANAVFDWVDPDDQQRFPGGAEDLYYLRQAPASKAANQGFASVSELRLISGMTDEIYAALTPHVTLWGNGDLNINSADSHLTREKIQDNMVLSALPAPVILRTLNGEDQLSPLTEEAAWQIVNRRIDQNGFRGLDFLEQGQLAPLLIEQDGLGLASSYFSLAAELELDSRRYQVQSVLFRYFDSLGIPGVRVISRHVASKQIDMDEFCVN